MEPWRTGITTSDAKSIYIRGYEVASLMRQATFTDIVFLLHQARLPSKEERSLFDAILIGVSDHGAEAPSAAAARIVASGNRRSLEAAVAAGVLAMGDAHGGAASDCMQMIADGIAAARAQGVPLQEAAGRVAEDAKAQRRRLPGIGHRVHTEDPRTRVLFEMAGAYGVARDGVAFMQALEAAARERIRPLPINIDGAMAAVLHDLGFAPAVGRLVFIIGRVTGVTAHVMEEHVREKPMRVRFPVSYDGPPPRKIG